MRIGGNENSTTPLPDHRAGSGGCSRWLRDTLLKVSQEQRIPRSAGQGRKQADRRAATTAGMVEMVGVFANISFHSLLSILIATFNKRVWSIMATIPTMATPGP
jgi:hypothetical protein